MRNERKVSRRSFSSRPYPKGSSVGSKRRGAVRTSLADDIVLAKQTPSARPSGSQKRKTPIQRPKRKTGQKANGAAVLAPAGKKGLADWLTPKNIQQSIKSVNNLRGMVKNCLNYLQQADQMLETFYVTSNSLRETGVLEKLVKGRGKNLTTEDFTGILAALMSSPIGGQLFKSMGGSDEEPTQETSPPTQPPQG